MEIAYIENRSHDFEIVKNVSLRQINPAALLKLRENSNTTFWLDELLFDMDFPVQYFRRIKSVSISLPCIIGPYTSLNCILSLVEHRTRVSASSKSYVYQGRNDTRFRSENIPISSIAISSGQSDAGVFELNFTGERYLPFEGAGAISKWKLEFPAAHALFDYSTISDAILHIRYTAIDGGMPLRQSANTAVANFIGMVKDTAAEGSESVTPTAMLDLKNDYCNNWYSMLDRASVNTVKITGLAERLPFFTKNLLVTMKGVALFIRHKARKSAPKVVVLKPEGITLGASTDEALAVQGSVAVVANTDINVDIGTEWELRVESGKEDLENVHVLFKYCVGKKAVPSQ